LLTDPQTSGGLLVACKAERAEAIRAMIEAAGYSRASIIGTATAGAPGIEVV
jgi:selenide,water dikinase